jgi:hypothetical protein
MKPFSVYLKNLLVQACVSYTVMTVLLFILGVAFPVFGDALELTSVLYIFGFSLLLGAANITLSIERLPTPLRLLFHYLATLLSFCVVFILIGARTTSVPAVLALVLLFTIVYVIAMGAYILIKNAIKNAKAKDYRQIYR